MLQSIIPTRRPFHSSLKKIFTLILILLFISVQTAAITATPSGGIITITVHVEGLADLVPAEITCLKIVEDVPIIQTATATTTQPAVFTVSFGGTCTISGGDVAGYLSPSPITVILTSLRGNLKLNRTLTYVMQEIPVIGLSITPTGIPLLLKGLTAQLEATIEPANASEQGVTWQSNNEAVATVSSSGLVTAVEQGEATITATTVFAIDDLPFTATCLVQVEKIIGFDPEQLDMLTAESGTLLALPKTVNAILSNSSRQLVPVIWTDDTEGVDANIVTVPDGQAMLCDEPGSFRLIGSCIGTDETVEQLVTVVGAPVVPVEDVDIVETSASVFVGKTVILHFSCTPHGAVTSGLEWVSSNGFATVTAVDYSAGTATVTGINTGADTIGVRRLGTLELMDSCTVNVSIDPTIVDPAYIQATTDTSPLPVDQFQDRESVYVRGYGLATGKFFVRVTDKGTGVPLGTGEIHVTIAADPGIENLLFNLYATTGFSMTNNYSDAYFVELSQNETFPSGDDENGYPYTYSDNFKITSPVPTGKIQVNVLERSNTQQMALPPVEGSALIGLDVILCRELKVISTLETTYEMYLNPLYDPTDPASPKYTDEVKMIGHILKLGDYDTGFDVAWEKPKEVLKIGGYVLLIELPSEGNYTTNLNQIDPNGDGVSLLKDVHILRNTTVVREVIVTRNG